MVRHTTQWKTSDAQALLAEHCRRLPTVARYTLDVLTGNVPAGRMVFLAVDRYLNDLKRSSDPKFKYYFDAGGACRIIKYFREFCPFKLEPFQQFIVANLYGWKIKGVECEIHKAGHRRFRTAYIETGKGSGKTPFSAGIGTFATRFDREPSAEVYVAAPSKKQAAICFRDAVNIVDNNRLLKKMFKQHGCTDEMLSGNLSAGTSFMKPISAEHKTLDGPRPHLVISDELHEHRNNKVLGKLAAGFKARHQPLSFEITNSGSDRETICFAHHDYSRQILEGVVTNDEWFAYVCQLDVCEKCRKAGKEQPTCDDCDSWLDEEVWIKANPGLGTILHTDYIHKQVKEALEIAGARDLVLRLNFCIWTEADERFINPESWRACGWEDVDKDTGAALFVGDPIAWRTHKLRVLKGKRCYGGLDLGVVDDFSCLVLYFPKQKDVPVPVMLLWAWVPEKVKHHGLLKERYGYFDWVRGDFLKLTPGPRTDYSIVEADILRLDREYRIEELAYDKAYSYDLVQRLIANGMTMVEHRQGSISMTGPIREFHRQILGQDFVHGMNPLLTFNVDNLVVESDGKGNLSCVKPENPKSPRKIDAAVAGIMATGRAALYPVATDDAAFKFL